MEKEKKSLVQLIAEAAKAQCKECDGRGWVSPRWQQCPKCSGRGKIYAS